MFDSLNRAAFAGLVAAALSSSPALAQRSVEFGYKDRIFEQNYLLSDTVSALEARNLVLNVGLLAMAAGNTNLFDQRFVATAGGLCVGAFVTLLSAPETTPAQDAIGKLPRTREPEGVEVLFLRPASEAEKCDAQLVAFRLAYADDLATTQQLAALARNMRARFADRWLSPAEVADPKVKLAAARMRAIDVRVDRLEDHGIDVPAYLRRLYEKKTQTASFKALEDDALFAAIDARLTAIEDEASGAAAR